MACMRLLIAAPVDRSACLGKRQQRVPGFAREMLSPAEEHRPWSATAGPATGTPTVALWGFLLDELSWPCGVKATSGCKAVGTALGLSLPVHLRDEESRSPREEGAQICQDI